MVKLLTILEPPLRALHAPAQALASCRSGATAIEYGLLVALVALALLTGLESFRDALVNLPMNAITAAIAAAVS